MTLSLLGGTAVFADGTDATTSSETVRTINFNSEIESDKTIGDMIWSEAKSVAGYAQGSVRAENGGYKTSDYGVEKGKFGRENTDQSIHLFRTDTTSVTDATQYVYFNEVENANSTVTNYTGAKTETGKYYELEVYMAWAEGTSDYRTVAGYLNNENTNNDGKYGDWEAAVLKVDTVGKVSVFGSNVGVTLGADKWHKFNLVVQAGDEDTATDDTGKNRYRLYVDNKLVKDWTVFTVSARGTNVKKFTGFKRYELTLRTSTKDTKTDGVWFDDFTVKNNLTAEPTYTQTSVTASGMASKYLGDNCINGYVDDRVSTSNLTFAEGTDASFVNADGSEATDFSAKKTYIRVNDNGQKLFGLIKNESKLVYSWDGSAVVGNNGNATQPQIVAGMSGKESTDNVYEISTTNTTSNDAYPYVNITNSVMGSKIDPTQPFTAEVSVRATGDFENVNIQMGYASGYATCAELYSDGTIKRGSSSAATYNKGEWIRIGFSVYPAANKYELTVNGKDCGEFTFSNASNFTRLRYEQKISAGKTAAFYLDDICVYQGSKPARSGVSLKSDDMSVVNDVIFTGDGTISASDFKAKLTNADSYSIKLYNDGTFASENTGNIAHSNVAVVQNAAEHIYKYYYVAKGDKMPLAVKSLAGGKITIDCFKKVDSAIAICASYDKDRKLVSTSIKNITPNSAAGTEISYPKTKEEDCSFAKAEGAAYAKVYIFGNLTSIEPFSAVYELN